jgi:hypothetical protein
VGYGCQINVDPISENEWGFVIFRLMSIRRVCEEGKMGMN